MQPDEVKALLEALLFCATSPLKLEEVSKKFDVSLEDLEKAIEMLKKETENGKRGIALRKVAGGYLFAVKPGLKKAVEDFFGYNEDSRFSKAALETLAIIAYRQPITLAEINAFRGVDSSRPVKSLLEKGLIKIAGRKKVPGKPLLYRTTEKFLKEFGLNSLEDLPSFEEFSDVIPEVEQPELFKNEDKT